MAKPNDKGLSSQQLGRLRQEDYKFEAKLSYESGFQASLDNFVLR